MKHLHLSLFTLLFCSFMAQSQENEAVIIPSTVELRYTVQPSDSRIQYTGRIDKSDKSAYRFSHCGVSIQTKFYGSSVAAEITEYGNGSAGGTNYFNVIIDGKVQGKPLQLMPGKHIYTLAQNLAERTHTIELFKRTESQVGEVAFHGFREEVSGENLAMADLPNLKLEFIGNSITCGYGNAVAYSAQDLETKSGFNSVNENNYMAYGAITARNLRAQYSCIAYSGRGLFQNNTGCTEGTVPQMYDRIFPDNPQSVWTAADRAAYAPHYIIINLGSNDFYAETSQGKNFYVEREKFVDAYVNFVNKLRSYYPQATIICTVGVMMSDSYPKNAQQWTRIQEYTQVVRNHFASQGDNNVLYLNLGQQSVPYGEDWHPSIATHEKMAKTLTDFILADMIKK
ncbi:MAG: GDSL-type esterase/lipase family protein [Bacteroidetes bacterium]|nr:GDSL-type esterase/lipase family protein [Bacteroidota bacterium]